jgi:DNA topoisomerase III
VQLIIAEKPSVARDLARVLGVPARGKGAFRGPRHVITWCIGHLVELDEPAAHDPAWKRWRLESLPMLPPQLKLRPASGTRAQWRVVRELLRDRSFDEVVNACDAGREGELIFRYCWDLARPPPRRVRRLWVSSLTDAALRAGLAALRPGSDFDALADAARCRSEADWLVGLNATRALTVRAKVLLSLGRVQTPTLALVVARERQIRDFVPERYDEVVGTFTTAAGATFKGLFHQRHDGARSRLTPEEAAAVVARDRAGPPPRVEEVEQKVEREPPPQLFDLTTLQRTASKRFGLSAKRTLAAAQTLYERHKLISYPRTDSRYLPRDVRGELPDIFAALETTADYAAFARAARASAGAPLPRVFDDRKVGDHHAIIPTNRVAPGALAGDEKRIYDLIVRRFLGAFYPDAQVERTRATVMIAADEYLARGHRRVAAGWQEAAGMAPDDKPLPPLAVGEVLSGVYEAVAKQTEPPPRFTDGTLLAAMESAGKEITDEALRQAMKEHGLGTPATRAQTIETLLARGYLDRAGKVLAPTRLGEGLLAQLPPAAASLASPELTGRWEARLARMARGEEARAAFMRDIADYVRDVIGAIRGGSPTGAPVRVGVCPRCKQGDVVRGRQAWGCARWREGCRLVIPFQVGGRAITGAQLRALLEKGVTRKTKHGKLRLDLAADPPVVALA